MNKQISLGQTINEALTIINTESSESVVSWFGETAASSDDPLIASVAPITDFGFVAITGVNLGTTTIHVTTNAHYNVGGTEFNKPKSVDVTFDVIPADNTELILKP